MVTTLSSSRLAGVHCHTNSLTHGLWNPEVLCHIHKGSPIIPILSRINLIPRFVTYSLRSIQILSSHLCLGLHIVYNKYHLVMFTYICDYYDMEMFYFLLRYSWKSLNSLMPFSLLSGCMLSFPIVG